MKKLILAALLFCLVSVLCFAKGNVEIFGGAPFNWEEGTILGYDTRVQTTSICLGFGLVTPINDRVAFGVYDEIIFPQKFETTVNGVKVSTGRDGYNSLMGMSVLIGPVFYLYSDPYDKIKIPLVAGFRWMWLSASTDYVALFGFNFGLEAGIGAEFRVSENAYVFGRLKGGYDFFAVSLITTGAGTKTNSGVINSFGLTPHIGVGFSF